VDKFSFSEVKKSQFVNFSPIMRNTSYKNSKEMIEEAMYHYMKENRMKVTKIVFSLFNYYDSHIYKSGRNDKEDTGNIAISSYYLWFLIDTGFIANDIKSVMTFIKYPGFKRFGEKFMRL
jgi:hypothetical protein